MYLPIDNIIFEDDLYPRNQLDWRAIARYAGALATGREFPPIVVGKSKKTYIGLDGKHRLEAYRKAGHDRIAALITRAPRSLWFAEAVRLNTTHGIPLSYQESLSAFMRLERDGLAPEQIERTLGIPLTVLQKSVGERGRWIRSEDVRPVVIKGVLKHTLRQRGRDWLESNAEQIDHDQRHLSCASEMALLRQVLSLVLDDLLPNSDSVQAAVFELREACARWLLLHQEQTPKEC